MGVQHQDLCNKQHLKLCLSQLWLAQRAESQGSREQFSQSFISEGSKTFVNCHCTQYTDITRRTIQGICIHITMWFQIEN